jgi:MoxR-like ATPase
LLALVSREHLYVEGVSGSAKTMLGEVVAEAAGLRHWFYQMHRDTRTSELIGEPIITRQRLEDTQLGKFGASSNRGNSTATDTAADSAEVQREVIRHELKRGGVLTCELAILDDISHAPVHQQYLTQSPH